MDIYTTQLITLDMNNTFKIKLNKEHYVFDHNVVSGQEILEAGGLDPNNYTLRLRRTGQAAPESIALTDNVDLSEPGIEQFIAIPKDTTEG